MILTKDYVLNLENENQKYWAEKLYVEYGDVEIGLTEIFQFVLKYRIHHEDDLYVINAFLRPLGIVIPRQGCIIERAPLLSRKQILEHLKISASNHSVYAYIASMFISSFQVNTTISEMKNIDMIFPKWLKIILDRQMRLCINANLKENDYFFFSYRNNHPSAQSLLDDVEKTRHCILKDYGYNVIEYIKQSVKFMETSAILYTLHKSSKYKELNKRYYIGLPVIAHHQKGRIIDIVEPGIYKCKINNEMFIVPHHQITIGEL